MGWFALGVPMFAIRKPFTLIELMTVICIILVLTSMLLPVSLKARSKAGQVSCNSNLKATRPGVFCCMPHGQPERLAPYITAAEFTNIPAPNWTRWTFPYYQDIGLLVCPASPQKAPEATIEGFHLYDGHYGWNYDGTQGNRGPLQCTH